MTASETLRARTAGAHEAVDAAFGGYDLSDRASYTQFLIAHARALPAAEAALAEQGLFPFRARAPLIAQDLAALGHDMPDPLPFAAPGGAAGAWGALYVIEGSRLGGGMLAQMVGEGLPSAYLADRHRPGEWRDFRHALDAAGEGSQWIDDAVAGAEACFALYGRAVVA